MDVAEGGYRAHVGHIGSSVGQLQGGGGRVTAWESDHLGAALSSVWARGFPCPASVFSSVKCPERLQSTGGLCSADVAVFPQGLGPALELPPTPSSVFSQLSVLGRSEPPLAPPGLRPVGATPALSPFIGEPAPRIPSSPKVQTSSPPWLGGGGPGPTRGGRWRCPGFCTPCHCS